MPDANICVNMLAAFPAYPTGARGGGGAALSSLSSYMGPFGGSVNISSLACDNSFGVWDGKCTLGAVGTWPEAQDTNDLSELAEPDLISAVLRSRILSAAAKVVGLLS